MNKHRRKRIEKARMALEELIEEIKALEEEEQEAYENMPASFQDSERGEAVFEAYTDIASAVYSLEDADEYLMAAIG